MPVAKSLLLRGRRGARHERGAAASAPSKPGLSVAVVAHNEGDQLPGCLESVGPIASEIVVVDAGSDDDTAAIAERYRAKVIRTENQLGVDGTKNLAIDAATYDWVLILDPDERVSPALREEIAAIVTGQSPFGAFLIPRRNYELGRWIRTMGHYPGAQLRLVRRGCGRYEPTRLHAHMEVECAVGTLKADLVHLPRSTVWDYAQKRNFYTEHDARQLFADGVRFSRRRLVLGPPSEFLRQYALMGGWLDGMPGFVIAVHGGWAKFLTEAKLWQLWNEGSRASAELVRPLSASPPSNDSANRVRDRAGVAAGQAGQATNSTSAG